MNLGQTIRQSRAKAGLSLRGFAKTLKVNASYISRIEKNAVRPSARVLERMAKALSMDADTLSVKAGYLPPSMRRNRRNVMTQRSDKGIVRESGVEYGTSAYQLSGPRAIEATEFPFERISDVAEMESWRKELNRPIYHVHKWWAQRLGSVFRSILLGAFLPQESDVHAAFYENHSFDNAVVLDPFMGSGTTLGEALKLGARAIGCDINPVAHFAVMNGLSRHSRADVIRTYGEIERDVADEIRRFYRAVLPSGVTADVLYYFWVMQVTCPNCRKPVDLFSSYVFATNAAPGKKHQGHAICPDCGKIEAVDVSARIHKCLRCSGQFSLEKGAVSGAKCACPHCRHVFNVAENATDRKSPPKYRLYAKLVFDEQGNRTYLEADDSDIRLFQEASRELGKKNDWHPVVPLSSGYNTDQAMNYGFTHWHHFFNARQLLCLGTLAHRIRQIPNENLRNLFACLFSGCLEFNNMFASYKGEGTGAVRHMFAHHILKPERMPIEANLWGTPKSSGAFSTLFQSRLLRALEYQNDPFELRVVWRGDTKTTEKVHGINHPLGEAVAANYRAFERGQRLCLLCGDSSKTGIPEKSVDAVITDPPFFDNVHYSQLADFFYAWHPYLLNGKHHNGHLTTRSDREVQQTDAGVFSLRLGDVWRECNRVLRDDGLMVFTYHHSRSEGWSALLTSLFVGDFYITAAHPMKSEMSVATPKQQARDPIDIDMIMVCRKRDGACKPKAVPGIKSVLQESLPAATRAIERMNATGRELSRNDVRVILASQIVLRLSRMKTQAEAQALFRTAERDIETEAERLFVRQEPARQAREPEATAQLSFALA
jgi:adenine-specific DNA methylase/DNA-binding XRE family transcriptional regulator